MTGRRPAPDPPAAAGAAAPCSNTRTRNAPRGAAPAATPSLAPREGQRT